MELLVRLLLKQADDVGILLEGFKDSLDRGDKTKLLAIHRATVEAATELREKYCDVPVKRVKAGDMVL